MLPKTHPSRALRASNLPPTTEQNTAEMLGLFQDAGLYFVCAQPCDPISEHYTKSQKNYIPVPAALHVSCAALHMLLTSLIFRKGNEK